MLNRFIVRMFSLGLMAVMLAACAGTPAAQTQPTFTPVVPATMAPAATVAPTATTVSQSDSTQAPTAIPVTSSGDTAGSSTGVRTFQIVPEQSEASYSVQEQFMNRSLPNLAVGKTQKISGTFQVDLSGTPSATVTKIEVDLSTLASDEGRRDQRLLTQWLQSRTYPLGSFTSTGVQDGPASYSEGQPVTFKLPGDLTVREITQPAVFDVTATLSGDTITGTATTQIMMKDFGIDPPDIAGMLKVTDGVLVTVNFTAKEVK